MGEKETWGEKIRQFIHPLVIKVLSARRNFKIEVTGEIPKDQQFIFVANHYCIDDIPTVAEVIHAYVVPLVSDEDRGTLNGLALDLNGVVWTNRLDKVERARSKEALIRHLHLGRSILMYPEATWNLSPNLPMLPMNYGCVAISLETGIPILPIYLHFTDDVCRINIGEAIYPSEDKVKSIEVIRDSMATAFWKYIENETQLCRQNLDPNYWEENISIRYAKYDRAKKDPVGVRLYESQFIYRPKHVVDKEEAFVHLSTLHPTMQNAFLFNMRLK